MIGNILFEVCFIYLKNDKNSGCRLHAENTIGIGQHQIWDEKKRIVVRLRLSNYFLPQYFFWLMKNANHLYPHVKNPAKKIFRVWGSILGVPILKRKKIAVATPPLLQIN